MNSHQWDDFEFVDIFDIRKGFYNKKPPCYENGNIPFIGATDSKNGITGFSDRPTIEANSKVGYGPNESIDRKLFPGNAICVTNNGSVGYAYYQPSEFTCTHDVNPLYLKPVRLNRHIAMFLIACIEKQRICFTYARKWRPKRMAHSKLMLPIAADGAPDWQFMEDFMRQKEQQILKPTLDRLYKQLILRKIQYNKHILLNLKWKEYIFGKEFSITATRSGIDRNKLKAGKGENPYITRTDISNGIDGFVNEQGDYWKKDEGNVITIGLDTQTVFYQVSDFYTGQNIQVIRHPKLDKYNATFIIVAIKKLVERFSWGSYGATLGRLRKSKIFLPANENGEIDFSFMSAYMREVEYNILNTTLKYFFER